MEKLSRDQFRLAREFIKTHARPIDQALFAYSFESGAPQAVWDALQAFANADGGFGHGMEPDCRVPDSSLLATITAFPYLLQTNAPTELPLVKNGIRYLQDTYDTELQGWHMLPPSANRYPRASWWHYDAAGSVQRVKQQWSNPSACVLAYLHHYHTLVPESLLRQVSDKALSVLASQARTLAGHDYLPFIELAQSTPDSLSRSLWPALTTQAPAVVETDPSQWTGYGIRPLWAVTRPDSPLMSVLRESVEAHLDFVIANQQPDGSWHPFWAWGQFEAEWQKAKVEWQGQMTVKLLRTLQAFGLIN